MNKTKRLMIMSIAAILALTSFAISSCAVSTEVKSDLSKISEFEAVDFDGNEVTQEVFQDAKLTMINYWGTYCMPCINEMPELAKINKEYEDFQLIGVPIDVDFSKPDSEEYKKALNILEEAGADFRNISLAGEVLEFAKAIPGIPTTIFVDSEGNMVGDPVVGAQTDQYRERIEEFLK